MIDVSIAVYRSETRIILTIPQRARLDRWTAMAFTERAASGATEAHRVWLSRLPRARVSGLLGAWPILPGPSPVGRHPKPSRAVSK